VITQAEKFQATTANRTGEPTKDNRWHHCNDAYSCGSRPYELFGVRIF
jgi:hypothetical protein